MKKLMLWALVALLVPAGIAVADEGAAETPAKPINAREAFSKLMGLEGAWVLKGPDGQESTFRFRNSANASTVMEIMHEGSDHEMINMYHLDGDDLVMTHYCAGGNQPTMRLDLEHATAIEWPFEFTGGTNLDPAVDSHIHAGKLVLKEDGHIQSHWTGWQNGKEAGTMVFDLARKDG